MVKIKLFHRSRPDSDLSAACLEPAGGTSIALIHWLLLAVTVIMASRSRRPSPALLLYRTILAHGQANRIFDGYRRARPPGPRAGR